MHEVLRKALHAREAELDVGVVLGDLRGAEEVVPEAERDAEVDAVLAAFRQGVHVVPEVHHRVVEDVLQRPPGDVHVGVVQVPDGDGGVEHDVGLFRGEAADQHHGDVLHGRVHHVLHPVVAQVRGEAHLLHAVVHLVEAPQPLVAVQQHVGEPLDEVGGQEEDEQLRPAGHGAQVQQLQLVQAGAEEVVHRHVGHLAEGEEDDQVEDVEVEEHVEGVQPEVLPDGLLFLAPGEGELQQPHAQAQGDQPPEVVHVPGVRVEGDLAPDVAGVVAKGVEEGVEVTFHGSSVEQMNDGKGARFRDPGHAGGAPVVSIWAGSSGKWLHSVHDPS